MTTCATLSYLDCATCARQSLHDKNVCIHCKTPHKQTHPQRPWGKQDWARQRGLLEAPRPKVYGRGGREKGQVSRRARERVTRATEG